MISHRALQTSLLLALLVGAAACTNPFSSSDSTTNKGSGTDTFSGALAPNGSIVFTFSVSTAGSVAVTLTAVSPSTTNALGLGVGPSNNGTCSVTNSTSSAVAGSSPQLTVNENPGTYCVRVSDGGSLGSTSNVTVTVAHS